MKGIYLILVVASIMILCGCSIGASMGDCEKSGCNYKRAGVCADAYKTLLSDPDELAEIAYKGIKCYKE